MRILYPPPPVNVPATAYRDSGEIDLSIPAAREAAGFDPQHTDAYVRDPTRYSSLVHVWKWSVTPTEQGRRRLSRLVEPQFQVVGEMGHTNGLPNGLQRRG